MTDLADNSSAEASDHTVMVDCESGSHALAPWAWSHRNAIASTDGPLRLSWGRIAALALTLALHLAVLLGLMLPSPPWPPATTPVVQDLAARANTSSERLQVVFVATSAAADPLVVAGEQFPVQRSPVATPNSPPRLPAAPPTPSMPSAAEPATAPTVPSGAAHEPPVPAAPQARLFHADGSVSLPATALTDLRAVESDARNFDYMTPGLATAESAFKRQSTVPYTPTRFDADWKPVRTLGDDVMHAISETLTYENERKTMRCSLVPPVCSWGRVDAAVELDDPHTLNPTEDAECRALWDTLVAAANQGMWLDLRKRYDAQCRKPLEREGVPFDDDAAKAVNVSTEP